MSQIVVVLCSKVGLTFEPSLLPPEFEGLQRGYLKAGAASSGGKCSGFGNKFCGPMAVAKSASSFIPTRTYKKTIDEMRVREREKERKKERCVFNATESLCFQKLFPFPRPDKKRTEKLC